MSLSMLTDALRRVVDGYFPEDDAPDSLFIGEEEQRGKSDLLADLVSAVIDYERERETAKAAKT